MIHFASMCLARHNQHLEAHLHASSKGNHMEPIFGAPAIDIDSYFDKMLFIIYFLIENDIY